MSSMTSTIYTNIAEAEEQGAFELFEKLRRKKYEQLQIIKEARMPIKCNTKTLR